MKIYNIIIFLLYVVISLNDAYQWPTPGYCSLAPLNIATSWTSNITQKSKETIISLPGIDLKSNIIVPSCGYITWYSSTNGQIIYKYDQQSNECFSNLKIDDDGNIYVLSGFGTEDTIISFYPDRKFHWKKNFRDIYITNYEVAQNSILLLAFPKYDDRNPSIISLNPNTGDIFWNKTFSPAINMSHPKTFLTTDSKNAFLTVGNYIYCLNSRTGEQLWEITLNAKFEYFTTGVISSKNLYYVATIISTNKGAFYGSIYIVDPLQNGKMNRIFTQKYMTLENVILKGSTLYFRTFGFVPSITAFRISNGNVTLKWSISTIPTISIPCSNDNNNLEDTIFVINEKTIYKYDSGILKGKYTLPFWSVGLVSTTTQTIYAVDNHHLISVPQSFIN
jgi:outer membrane protein assembly factor BamB